MTLDVSRRGFRSQLAVVAAVLASIFWWLAAPVQLTAQTFSTLYTFDSVNYGNGSQPIGRLAMDGNGVLYGVTSLGGVYTGCANGPGAGCGTVYSLTPPASSGGAWTETVLWSFGGTASDGANPTGLIMGRDGTLYGTTTYGGEADCGAVFSLTPPDTPGGPWTEAIIWSFPAGGGAVNPSGLIAGGSGGLYGANLTGGPRNRGDIYSLDPPTSPGGAWRHTELWFSNDEADGADPEGIVMGPDKTIYATAFFFGSGYSGLVFSLTPPSSPGAGWTETILYDFPAGTGWHPTALSLGTDGVLYGSTYLRAPTTKQGGTIFSLAPPASPGGEWTETTLWQFPTISRFRGTSDSPNGPLVVQPQTGALFGATGNGYTDGILFELVPPSGGSGWSEQVLPTGNTLAAPMLGLGRAGVLYGTDGETNLVWSLTP